MATKAEAWRAETDGTLHSNEKAATEHDLRILADILVKPNSTHVAANLGKHADLAIRLLEAHRKAHPGSGGGEVPSQAQKGPARAKPAPDAMMACCGLTFSECECDDAKVAAQSHEDEA